MGSVRAWAPIRHTRPCPLRGPIHLPSESAALHAAPRKRWCPLPCPATRAGYAWSSDGTSIPPPLRSPPRPFFNVTLFPPRALAVVNSFPADASSVPIMVQTPGRKGLPWGGGGLCIWVCLPLKCPRLPQCQPLPALAVCLGRESTGLRSGGRFLCVWVPPWPGSLLLGFSLLPAPTVQGTGKHPRAHPNPWMAGLPSPGDLGIQGHSWPFLAHQGRA